MLKKITIIINLVPMILSLVILGSILLWSPVCQGRMVLPSGMETHMKCFYMGQAGILISLILLAVSFENLLMNRKGTLAYIITGIVIFILPGATALSIGVCMHEMMACHTTALWLKVSGCLIILSGIGSFLIKGRYDIS